MSKLLFDTYSVTALERMKSVDLERYAVHGKGTVANLCDAMIYAKSQLAAKERECEELKQLIANETKALLARYKGDVMKTRDRKEHADGTIESLRTVVNTIREYALPELPPNELGQIPFMRAVFESVIDEIEASIARQETDRETAAANERYIFAIPALCRGENVTCAMHVSQPIATLRTQLAAKERECEELKRRVRELTIAGDAMYAYGDFTRSTFNVDSEWSRIITKESPP